MAEIASCANKVNTIKFLAYVILKSNYQMHSLKKELVFLCNTARTYTKLLVNTIHNIEIKP